MLRYVFAAFLTCLTSVAAYAESLDLFKPCPRWMVAKLEARSTSLDCAYRTINLTRSGHTGTGIITGRFSVNAATPQRVFIFDDRTLVWDSRDQRQPGSRIKRIAIDPAVRTARRDLYIVGVEGRGGRYRQHRTARSSVKFLAGGLITVRLRLDDGNIGGPRDKTDFRLDLSWRPTN